MGYLLARSLHKKQTRITTSVEVYAASSPDIYGNKITYVKNAYNERESWYELYVYDLSTKKETQIPTIVSAHNPSIYGNRIVWLDFDSFNGGDYNIYMYDLSTKKQVLITKVDFSKAELTCLIFTVTGSYGVTIVTKTGIFTCMIFPLKRRFR